jgi:NAD(P)-dependent dehydrogenase (short-subunit alcohol dehydrogenase family)
MTERVVITGANRGLGLVVSRVYAARGDEVWP